MVNVHKQNNQGHYVKRNCARTAVTPQRPSVHISLVRAAGTLRAFRYPT
ncbi:hypothetical protein PEC301296_32420 [Pectobacterium carotovorum subsp. carotovorum]|nr:hypothetical protein PB72LOC_02413 [Pectobacterium atrosepticum]GKV86931.1 hypothetical protein PEC301296_32420 [Pectobacterium carotovorum subsp. carotovorum]